MVTTAVMMQLVIQPNVFERLALSGRTKPAVLHEDAWHSCKTEVDNAPLIFFLPMNMPGDQVQGKKLLTHI